MVPRALWASGPWVPSEAESYWLYAVFAAVVCVIGVLGERQRPRGLLRLVALTGLGVPPAPAGPRVAEG